MRGRTLAFLGLFGWTGGCAAQAESIDDDTSTDTGGSAATGGGPAVDGSDLLEEGETLLGACMSPSGNPCRDYLAYPVLDGEYTTEAAYEHCYNRYTDAFSESLWREGEHCPLDGAAYVCKSGVEIIYHYGDLLPEAEPDEACEIGWELVYWSE